MDDTITECVAHEISASTYILVTHSILSETDEEGKRKCVYYIYYRFQFKHLFSSVVGMLVKLERGRFKRAHVQWNRNQRI